MDLHLCNTAGKQITRELQAQVSSEIIWAYRNGIVDVVDEDDDVKSWAAMGRLHSPVG